MESKLIPVHNAFCINCINYYKGNMWSINVNEHGFRWTRKQHLLCHLRVRVSIASRCLDQTLPFALLPCNSGNSAWYSFPSLSQPRREREIATYTVFKTKLFYRIKVTSLEKGVSSSHPQVMCSAKWSGASLTMLSHSLAHTYTYACT